MSNFLSHSVFYPSSEQSDTATLRSNASDPYCFSRYLKAHSKPKKQSEIRILKARPPLLVDVELFLRFEHSFSTVRKSESNKRFPGCL